MLLLKFEIMLGSKYALHPFKTLRTSSPSSTLLTALNAPHNDSILRITLPATWLIMFNKT